ncbi:hypothetical protein B0A50_04027 [Salinomyces thailandicus]|uniref:Uncharacterized protein n=1 Tax=Salinomyces thailandicus TaxID=706561 RepID=A0A4U0TZE5_9PEZI|nr:hypothetical protein B0A50_04027 [Salinomyces thailandica]
MTSGPASQRDFLPALLRLPRELRDEIYTHLFPPMSASITTPAPHPSSNNSIPIGTQPPSTRVNTQLRHETLPLFYHNTTFQLALTGPIELMVVKAWLRSIGDGNVWCLRRVVMSGWVRVPFGHMVSRRWVELLLDLRDGGVEEVVRKDGDGVKHPRVGAIVERVRAGLKRLEVGGDQGVGVDVKGLCELMEVFYGACVAY